MRVFLDSSALVKRSVAEPESDALEIELALWNVAGDDLLCSVIAHVEVGRVIRSRLEKESPFRVADLVDEALAGVAVMPLDSRVVSVAQRLGPGPLRTLDALHLATAALLSVDVFVAYDHRLLIAAREHGFTAASPS